MIRMHDELSPTKLREAFGAFPTGVVAVCAHIDGSPAGLAASSFTSVSMDPPLVSVCIQKTSTTWPVLRDRPRLGISVMSETQSVACRQLASKIEDRFAAVEWDRSAQDGVFLQGSSAWMEVSLHTEVDAGDHTIALLQVHGLDVAPHVPPLLFHASQFRQMAVVLDES